MVITEQAGEMLMLILKATQSNEDECIRLDLACPREGLRVGKEMLGDEIVEFDGRRVLAMDSYTAETCARHILDIEDGRFVLMGMERQWLPAEQSE